MVILGLDPGLAKGTAWALMDDGTLQASGTFKAGGTDPELAHAQACQLYRLVVQDGVSLVCVETQFGAYTDKPEDVDEDAAKGRRFASTKAALRLAALRGALCVAAIEARARVIEVAPATVKKCVTDNGRATKQQVQAAVRSLTGLSLSQDKADAAAVAIAGQARAFPMAANRDQAPPCSTDPPLLPLEHAADARKRV